MSGKATVPMAGGTEPIRVDPAAVVARLEQVLGRPTVPIPLHEPRLDGNAWAHVKDALDSTFVSSVGAYVDRFEAMLCELNQVSAAVAVVNGTAALHVALRLAGVQPGDEVMVQTLTFVATANAVTYCNAVPHFCDSEEASLGLDASRLDDHLRRITHRQGDGWVNSATGRRIAAIVPTHVFGLPADMAALEQVAADWRLPLVADAAEALGSRLDGRPVAGRGLLSTVSFNGNKIVTTGGGGAILTNDSALGRQAKHLTTTAKRPHPWRFDHDDIGYNYRLPNLNAALGVAQLERLDSYLDAKRRLAARYRAAFSGLAGASIRAEPAGADSNCWLVALALSSPDGPLRDAVLEATRQSGYETRPIWTPMHRLAIYAGCPIMDLGMAESLSDSIVCLPSSACLELDQIGSPFPI